LAELLAEVVPALAGPVAPVLPEVVVPRVLALPDCADEPEFDDVLTAPDWPPLPESPETATGLEVALPVLVEPVEPVEPDVASALPHDPKRARQGAITTAGPEFPEFPEFPELPDVAVPVPSADPVFPESALPELAFVTLPLDEVAFPVLPPVVEPSAVEFPLLPDVAVEDEVFCAFPVEPDLALPPVPWPFDQPFEPPIGDPPS
jgi:hypothetical protein